MVQYLGTTPRLFGTILRLNKFSFIPPHTHILDDRPKYVYGDFIEICNNNCPITPLFFTYTHFSRP